MNFNENKVPDVIESSAVTDLDPLTIAEETLSTYRDDETGLVGVTVTVRPYLDDPLQLYGEPNYYFQKKLYTQVGL